MEKFVASMLLSAAGDALGFKNSEWEFQHDGEKIHKQLKDLGGVANLKVSKKNWRVSDDTILHIATGEALVSDWSSKEELYLKLAANYKEGMRDMRDRAAGNTLQMSIHQLKPGRPGGYIIPFNPRGGGCGAAMRSMCIGLLLYRPEHLDDLIAVSVESGRMTHNHPTGYLGALTAALFTSFAIQAKPIREWGVGLMSTLPKALKYVQSIGRDVKENEQGWSYFTDKWTKYLMLRGILDGTNDPKFADRYTVSDRDKFYKSLSYSGWAGSSGHDAPMIAYDALLGAGDSWEELCHRGMFHGGDSDSTGVMAGAWWGALHGFDGVPVGNYKNLEYRERIENIAKKLYEKAVTLGET
ncbi:predicted protein [Nematostella vectensis]|uniref:ADP-ribosylhydrolase ARH1 n=2 Tax=Nematostella vectensis TaxID=45351 RepID=A7SS50_NEMVE|nr:ADP-ribosylhydrolase ARH1 isoform X1 [Nematostella vectensis]EDO33452.1 predicted protein [Nematostella vectensis]|eukprot:XP_001625552.1 predicted protein [Nematostella vectensis]